MKRRAVFLVVAGLLALAGCGGSGESLHLEVRAAGRLDLATVKGLALIGTALSERTWSVQGRDLEADPLTVGLDAPTSAVSDRATLLLVGYDGQGKAAVAWSGQVNLGLDRGVTATLAELDANCDSDGDGFLACGQAECCDADAKAFVDCDDANAAAYPYDATACQVCPNGCGGGEGNGEVVEDVADVADGVGIDTMDADAPDVAPDVPVCTDACASKGKKECTDGNHFRTCDDYNSDGCLEWSVPSVCSGGDACTGEGNCACQTDCTGKVCGDDGCGGTCGTCSGGKQCQAGQCACASDDHKSCSGGNLYWYDSCGAKENLAQSCSCGCSGSACVAAQCTSGACCDGCNYKASSVKCAEDVTTEYTCKDGTGCGADVYVHHQDRYCSGSGAACDGALKWDTETVADNCTATETCTAGDATCNTNASCAEQLMDNGNGTITDTKTNLVWQKTPNASGFPMCTDFMDYNSCPSEKRKAANHCTNNEDGLPGTGWRLPTISELRSLIRGCPGTMTGGACDVTDSCLSSSCWTEADCWSCSSGGGPDGGCYWDVIFDGNCTYFWSSSLPADNPNDAWGVYFDYGHVGSSVVSSGNGVRCVRAGP